MLPASVRSGTPAQKQAYETALQFEQVLVQQLSTQLASTAGLDGSSNGSIDGSTDGSSDPTASIYQQMLPQALTQGLMGNGGLGLAAQLAPGLDPSYHISSQSTGATTTTHSASGGAAV
jgi:Rod binding domain-containing protein